MPFAAVIGAGVGLIGSSLAADAQQDAANKASDTQLQLFDKQSALSEPYRRVGEQGLNKLAVLLGLNGTGTAPAQQAAGSQQIPTNALNNYLNALHDFYNLQPIENSADATQALYGSAVARLNQAKAALQNQPLTTTTAPAAATNATGAIDPQTGELLRSFSLADFQTDPGYGFRLAEQEKAINRSAGARGRFNSGATLKALLERSGNLASDEYSNAYNRFNLNQTNKFNRLAAISGIGQTAVQQLGNQSSVLGQSLANNITGAGNARASGYIGAANAINSGIGNYQQQNYLSQLGGVGGANTNPYANSYGGFDYASANRYGDLYG
jgi:hypothetical protein